MARAEVRSGAPTRIEVNVDAGVANVRTGSGKVIRVKSWRGHHLEIKSSRRTRRYAGKAVLVEKHSRYTAVGKRSFTGSILPQSECIDEGGEAAQALPQAQRVGEDLAFELMRSLGCDVVIDYKREDFTRTGARYDLILDVKTMRSPFDFIVPARSGLLRSISTLRSVSHSRSQCFSTLRPVLPCSRLASAPRSA